MKAPSPTSALQPLQGYQLEPPHYYEPAWFDAEQRQLFGQCWNFVGFEHDVASPGDYMAVDVGHDPILITRDESGTLHALHNVCRHRGIRLYGDRGNVKALSCPYHAWRYALDGALEHVPQHKEQFPQLVLSEWGLLRASVATWAGMMFVHPNPDAPPLDGWLGGLGERLKRFDASNLVELNVQHYEMAANWKLFIENHIDWLHLYFLHARTLKDYHHDQGELRQHGPHWTSFEQPKPGREGSSQKRQAGMKPLPGLLEEDSDIGAHLIFPNIAIFTSPFSFTSVYVRPIGPERCRVELRAFGLEGSDPQSLESDEFKQVMVEDRQAAEELQRAVRSRAYAVGPMALEWEAPIAHFHHHYRVAMGL